MAVRSDPIQDPPSDLPPRPPAFTPEARENEMIALAVDFAEAKLRDGTATTPVVVHYLKLATERERLEREKLIRENELLQMKAEHIASTQKMEAIYEEALEAMKKYSGN